MNLTFGGPDGRWQTAVNFMNPLGTKGNMTRSFARLLSDMWREGMPITPFEFRVCQKTICVCRVPVF